MDGEEGHDSFCQTITPGEFCPLHPADNHFSQLIRRRNGFAMEEREERTKRELSKN